MTFRPYYAKDINKWDALHRPSTPKARNNRTFAFWERALFERAKSAIEITFPEAWHGRVKDFLLFVLFRNGFFMVGKNDEYGYFGQPCTIKGFDLYYQPTNAIVANPASQSISKEYEIGKDCEILKLTPDYMGIWDIIDRYAEELSHIDNSLDLSLINSKFAWLLGAKTKGAACAIRKAFDQINRGEPLAIYDQRISDDSTSKTEPFQFVDFNVKGNYITTDLLMDFSTILRNFDCEIGIPSVPYEKKERLVTEEANARQFESIARATIWVDCVNESAKDIKALYPEIDISAKIRFDDMEGGLDNGDNDNVNPRAL